MSTARTTNEAVVQGLAYLRRVQAPSGAFLGQGSSDPSCRRDRRTNPTIFFTALILDCLCGVPGAEDIRQRAAEYLLAHRSPDWSWNYWERPAASGRSLPAYPDDLDDTACALAALTRHDARMVDERALAAVAQLLIRVEVAPGGPYRTWLVEPDAPASWRDVDLAVNANIGYLMSLHGVRLPSLEAQMDAALKQGCLASRYYIGSVPVLYFVARWYRGANRGALSKEVAKALASAAHPLQAALLTTSAVRLGLEPGKIARSALAIVAAQSQGCWPATALYPEPIRDGRKQYAGSEALTTAFCLEALVAAAEQVSPSRGAVRTRPRPVQHTSMADYLGTMIQAFPAQGLRRKLQSTLAALLAQDVSGQKTNMAGIIANATNLRGEENAVRALNAASVCGWLAYTLYDDVIDEESSSEKICLANVAARLSVGCFAAALPAHRGFRQEVETAFWRMDAANFWELTRTRFVVQDGVLQTRRLPDYGSLQVLADRSGGHGLAALAIVVLKKYSHLSASFVSLKRFFHHFLIARQLNDDLHDWEADLAKGHITVVNARLLRPYAPGTEIDLVQQREELQVRFWEQVVPWGTRRIQQQTAAARRALQACDAVRDKTALMQWLGPLERSARRAQDGQAAAVRFLAAFAGEDG